MMDDAPVNRPYTLLHPFLQGADSPTIVVPSSHFYYHSIQMWIAITTSAVMIGVSPIKIASLIMRFQSSNFYMLIQQVPAQAPG